MAIFRRKRKDNDPASPPQTVGVVDDSNLPDPTGVTMAPPDHNASHVPGEGAVAPSDPSPPTIGVVNDSQTPDPTGVTMAPPDHSATHVPGEGAVAPSDPSPPPSVAVVNNAITQDPTDIVMAGPGHNATRIPGEGPVAGESNSSSLQNHTAADGDTKMSGGANGNISSGTVDALADATQPYRVVKGDTMWGIAKANGMTLQQLEALNPQVTHPELIQPGDPIHLGGGFPPTSNYDFGNNASPAAPHSEPTGGGTPPPSDPENGTVHGLAGAEHTSKFK